VKFKLEGKRERGELEEAVLASIKAAGFLTLALVVPKAAAYLVKRKKKQKKNDNWYLGKITAKLIERGLIKTTKEGLELSEKGEERLKSFEVKLFKRPKYWDGKYRLVIFDIPEKKRQSRKQITGQLIAMGFIRLQQSVWIGLYDCSEIIGLMRMDANVRNNLIYMTVESIENDQILRQQFGVDE
jgi:CRISPR/Cas system-associated endoribonuclease Cas2